MAKLAKTTGAHEDSINSFFIMILQALLVCYGKLPESYITGPHHSGFCFYATLILTSYLQVSLSVHVISSKGGRFLYINGNYL